MYRCPYCKSDYETQFSASICRDECHNEDKEMIAKVDITGWKCDTCETIYMTEDEAKTCEIKHIANHPEQKKLSIQQ